MFQREKVDEAADPRPGSRATGTQRQLPPHQVEATAGPPLTPRFCPTHRLTRESRAGGVLARGAAAGRAGAAVGLGDRSLAWPLAAGLAWSWAGCPPSGRARRWHGGARLPVRLPPPRGCGGLAGAGCRRRCAGCKQGEHSRVPAGEQAWLPRVCRRRRRWRPEAARGPGHGVDHRVR